MPRLLSILSVLALIFLAFEGALHPAPILEIRDRIDVVLDPVRRLDDQAFVRGRLLERASGDAVEYLPVHVRIDDFEATLQSDDAGYFSGLFEIEEGSHILSVDVDGSDKLDAAHFEMSDFDIDKSPLALRLHAPLEIADTADELLLDIAAQSGDSGAALTLALYYASAGEPLRSIGSATTNSQGTAAYAIPREKLGPPGRKRVEIRFRGNDNYDAAVAGANLNITGSSALSLEVDSTHYDYADTLYARGRLLDGRGDPIVGAVISIEVNSQRIGNTKTEERGDYRMKLDTEELGSGTTAMQSVYRPSESWNSPSHSEPVTIEVGDRKPIPISSTLAAFAITSLALLSFVGMRTRPWERWLRRARAEEVEPGAKLERGDVLPPTGLLPSRPKLSSALRRAHYFDIDGSVLDAVTKSPIAEASIRVLGAAEKQLASDAEGRYFIGELSEGQHEVQVSAFSYVSESFPIGIPHRGELRGAVICMLPVREKIFALYKEAVRHLLPDPKLWGIWTPRQILDHVRSQTSTEALSGLTDFVEESFFSARRPGEELLELAEEKIAAVHREEARG